VWAGLRALRYILLAMNPCIMRRYDLGVNSTELSHKSSSFFLSLFVFFFPFSLVRIGFYRFSYTMGFMLSSYEISQLNVHLKKKSLNTILVLNL
jgi:hypothetical protein